MGTDGKFPLVSLRTNQELQETFPLSPSIVGRIPAKVGSLWSLRVWGLRLEISGHAEFFPGPCLF